MQPNSPEVTTDFNTMAILGGILGIGGWVLAWIPFFGIIIGLLLGVLAVIFSGVGLARVQGTGKGKGWAIAGLVFGIMCIIWKLIPGLNVL